MTKGFMSALCLLLAVGWTSHATTKGQTNCVVVGKLSKVEKRPNGLVRLSLISAKVETGDICKNIDANKYLSLVEIQDPNLKTGAPVRIEMACEPRGNKGGPMDPICGISSVVPAT